MDELKYSILHQIHPALRKYIMYIWTHGKTGVCSGNIQVLRTISSIKSEEGIDAKYANQCTLSIPYAGHYLEWEVKFCSDDMSFAPDFDFRDDAFLGELNVDSISKKLPSWANWNATDPSALHKVLMELLIMYKKHQICLLEAEKYNRLHFEFSSLIGETGVAKDDVEVLIEPFGIVHFLIALAIDFSSLPPEIFMNLNTSGKNVGAANAVLMVTFPKVDGTNVQSHLFISPVIEHSLLGIGNKHIPPFPSDGCLMDYVPAIENLIIDRIQFIVDSYVMKQKYIIHLLTEFPLNMLEYDNLSFSKATLLFETEDFKWLLNIVISNNFPRDKPKWTLRSIYQMSFDEPVTEILHNYPYSPRWHPEEMVMRALKYTIENIPQFQLKKK